MRDEKHQHFLRIGNILDKHCKGCIKNCSSCPFRKELDQISTVIGSAVQGPRKKTTNWTKEEDKILKDCYFTHTQAELAEKLGRSINAVKGRANKKGLKKEHPLNKSPWPKKKVKFLTDNYGKLSLKDIATTLGVSTRTVSLKVKEFGLRS